MRRFWISILALLALTGVVVPVRAEAMVFQESATVQVNIVVETFAQISISGATFEQAIAANDTQTATFNVDVQANYGFQMQVQPSDGSVGADGQYQARFNDAAPAGTTSVSIDSGSQSVPLFVSVTNTNASEARTFRIMPVGPPGSTATVQVEQLNEGAQTITLTVGASN